MQVGVGRVEGELLLQARGLLLCRVQLLQCRLECIAELDQPLRRGLQPTCGRRGQPGEFPEHLIDALCVQLDHRDSECVAQQLPRHDLSHRPAGAGRTTRKRADVTAPGAGRQTSVRNFERVVPSWATRSREHGTLSNAV